MYSETKLKLIAFRRTRTDRPAGNAGLEADPQLTVISVDVSAAYDTVSRQSMLEALRDTPSLSPLLPFAQRWYARESAYVWTAGPQSHRIAQAEGGEQGDPLMPTMFSLGFGPALRDLQADLRPGEHALAYLDDAYILASPARAIELYHRLEHCLCQGTPSPEPLQDPVVECCRGCSCRCA